ncbi:stalk domain-containing protein [Paenibacillus filicis]|uniref:Stalk domain-containing protein n=1 Tax=Paenibacillus gyeongsangnamensis TaxID=3388067 RepID=A0ABT4Q5E9_9BACL|nr:stalk domain-containing protein [Paenibacillus filicis]MCZ8512104.1 stalk domain-containing protein [Paenibacillus filicis]
MNRASKIAAGSLLIFALIGSGGVSAASIGKTSLRGGDNQILTSVTTEAGTGALGSENGGKLTALFRSPAGLTALPDGTLLVSDTRNHLIRSIKDNLVATYAGMLYQLDDTGFPVGGLLDGKKDRSVFQGPMGLAADAAGNVYVADSANNAIRKIGAGGTVSTLAGSGLLGSKDGAAKEATFHHPSAVAVAADGTVYVADTLNHMIRSISPSGQVSTLNSASSRVVEVTPGQVVAAGDYQDGDLKAARFNEPTGLVLDQQGNLVVSDSGNQRIRYIDLKQGKVTTLAGGGFAASGGSAVYDKHELYVAGDYADGDALQARFHFPMGIAVTEEGGVVIADSQNHAVRYLLDGRVYTLAGAPDLTTGEEDGTERGARLNRPAAVAVSADGSIYVADSYNNKVRKISPYRLPADLPANDQVKVVLDSAVMAFDAQPEIVNGRTMVPVRAITEALGFKVTFDDATSSVQLTKDGTTVELYVGKTGIKRLVAGKDAQAKPTDVEPYIRQDRTYVPVRFFAEEIGLDVQWNDENRTVILRQRTDVKL